MSDYSSIAPGEVLVCLDAIGPDSLGRQSFTAYWLDDYLPPEGVRGQRFRSNLAEFTRRSEAVGRKVTVQAPDIANLDLGGSR